jgi:WXG100 family type VII secretion target
MTTPHSPAGDGTVNYRVTPAEVSAAAVAVDSTAAEIQTQLGTLKTYVVNVESIWRGIAGNTFQALMVDYDIFANMLHNALTDIASGLRGNYVNYVESEQLNISNLQVVHATLPPPRF